jgi:hypothetical protein
MHHSCRNCILDASLLFSGATNNIVAIAVPYTYLLQTILFALSDSVLQLSMSVRLELQTVLLMRLVLTLSAAFNAGVMKGLREME